MPLSLSLEAQASIGEAEPDPQAPAAPVRQERMKRLRPPFPWFGGKARVCHLVWPRFGEVRNYVEPFFGGGAVLLGRPGEPGIETVNDKDGHLANFWRAVQADPDQVAHFADGPVNEVDLHARHRWLVETADPPTIALQAAEREALAALLGAERGAEVLRLVDRWDGADFLERMKSDPEYYDAKRAGWWVWGQCLWIGSGWCARPEWTGRVNAGKDRRSIESLDVVNYGKLPALAGRDAGRGAYAVSRSGKRPALTGNGGGVGVNAPGLDQKRPVLQHGKGGRGVHRLSHQIPDLSGDSGAAGRGIHASGGVVREAGGLLEYMRALSDRLRRVRVCCGDFQRILGPAVTTCIGTTGVFLDPPYPEEGRDLCYNHDGEGVWWRAYQWAIDHGHDPLLRIALCGYEHPDAVFPPDWVEVPWKASGGYGSRTTRGQANACRERIWFSPHCLPAEPDQRTLRFHAG